MSSVYHTIDGVTFSGRLRIGRDRHPVTGVLIQSADPSQDTYPAIEDNRNCNDAGELHDGFGSSYYTREVAVSLTGPLGDPATQAQEAVSCTQIPIADLYALKSQEIANQDQRVRYASADASGFAAWWIVVSERARFELTGIQGNWLQRQIDGAGWPGGVNQPRIGILNQNSGLIRREAVPDAATWDALYLDVTMHDQAVGNATNASGTALDAAYADGAGDWQAVADHDAADPAWGYPPTQPLP